MAIRVGINGFGRMGRLVARVFWDWPEIELVHINEHKGGPENAAHLLTFDSVHGRWQYEAEARDNAIQVDDRSVSFSDHVTPGEVPWDDLGVDMVLECSGAFRTEELLQPYFDRGGLGIPKDLQQRLKAWKELASAYRDYDPLVKKDLDSSLAEKKEQLPNPEFNFETMRMIKGKTTEVKKN